MMAAITDHFLLWTVVAMGGLFVCIFALSFYRLYLHRLSSHPGPLLAKLTDLYQLHHAYKGDRHLDLWRLHQVYGPVVRFGPNSLSFNSPTALKGIYGFGGNVMKGAFYEAFVHPMPNTHNVRDRGIHGRKRRVLGQGCGDNAVRGMERYLVQNLGVFCEVIRVEGKREGVGGVHGQRYGEGDRKGWSEARNMGDWFSYLAMDVLGDLCYGRGFGMLEGEENRYALGLVAAATRRHLICGTMPIIDKLGLDKLLFPGIAAGRAKFMAYSKQQLTQRTKLGDDTDRRDFFYHLLKARDPVTGQGFTTPELWAESNLLIIAGSDTTSTAMAATLFYLVRDASALEKATMEVRERFGDVEEIRGGPGLNGCGYLRGCVDEGMRMSPSVGGLLPREVLAGGMRIDGVDVPEGTVVGVPHYALQHHGDIYRAPFCFVPERWIVGATARFPCDGSGEKAGAGSGKGDVVEIVVGEDDVKRAHTGFCPFSIGPRGCIGKGIAYQEMLITLARILWLYDVRRAAGVDLGEGGWPGAEWGRHRKGEFQLVDTFTSLKDGPVVEFRRRDYDGGE